MMRRSFRRVPRMVADSLLSRRSALAGIAAGLTGCAAPSSAIRPVTRYFWDRLPDAPFPGAYNFQVIDVAGNRYVALHPQGIWSMDNHGVWTKEALPLSGTASPYLAHAAMGGIWALGRMRGDYTDFTIDPLVQRTRDYRRWEVIGRPESLPRVIFYAHAPYRLMICGGFDGKAETNACWRSDNGLDWHRLPDAPWSPRAGAKMVRFRDRLFLIGGGRIDGPQANDVWSTGDNGLSWRRETARIAAEVPHGYAPVVFDERLWLIGANRSGAFTSEMLVSADGRSFEAAHAPWSPRGGVAAWATWRRMYVTGGKYSAPDPATGEQRFVYSRDVWEMRRDRPDY